MDFWYFVKVSFVRSSSLSWQHLYCYCVLFSLCHYFVIVGDGGLVYGAKAVGCVGEELSA